MARLNQAWNVEADGAALATELHRILKVSHRQAKGIIDAGCVKINGKDTQSHGHRLVLGDQITVDFDPATQYQPLPAARKDVSGADFEILWEDKHLVFVNKPAGLLTVPTEAQKPEACLAEALTEHYQRRGFKRFKLYIVHRLDRYTSGVLVFAKTPEALHGLTDMFEEHRLQRVYKAILVGELPENAGVLTDKLVERQKTLKMEVLDEKAPAAAMRFAKRAITHYRVLERLPGHTLVEIKLETGRRNQIRVQFADRGFPLLGDPVYGEASPLIRRQALHAELLGFRHPVTEDAVSVTVGIAPDMAQALAALRTRSRVLRAESGVTGEEGIYKPKASKQTRQGNVQRARRFEEDGNRGEGPSKGRGEGRGERATTDRPFRPGRPAEGRPSRPRVQPGEGRGPRDRADHSRDAKPVRPGSRSHVDERPGGRTRFEPREEDGRRTRSFQRDGSEGGRRPEGAEPRGVRNARQGPKDARPPRPDTRRKDDRSESGGRPPRREGGSKEARPEQGKRPFAKRGPGGGSRSQGTSFSRGRKPGGPKGSPSGPKGGRKK